MTAGEHIGVAVSGGADSMVLLDLLLKSREQFDVRLTVLHYNHRLRQEAGQEEDLVRRVCEKKDLPFIVGSADVAEHARKNKISIETAARQLRYDFFATTAREMKLDKIATGHTASDQAETVLDHILRGAGIRGLTGIPVQRDIYIRPLLFAERSDIEKYAKEQNLRYCLDASNQDITFKRNRIRHTLLPLLQREFNPQIITALNRLGEHAAQADELLTIMAEEALRNCVKHTLPDKIVLEFHDFLAYLNSLQRLVLRSIFEHLGHDPNLLTFSRFGNITQFLQKQASGTLKLAKDLYFVISGDELIIGTKPISSHFRELRSAPGRYFLWDNLFLEIKVVAKPLTCENKNRNLEFIDADKLQFPLLARSVQDGDFFSPVNGKGRKKVKDFFIDAKIPLYERKRVPILESGGKIVWICGHRLDDRFKVSENSETIYQLQLIKSERQNAI